MFSLSAVSTVTVMPPLYNTAISDTAAAKAPRPHMLVLYCSRTGHTHPMLEGVACGAARFLALGESLGGRVASVASRWLDSDERDGPENANNDRKAD